MVVVVFKSGHEGKRVDAFVVQLQARYRAAWSNATESILSVYIYTVCMCIINKLLTSVCMCV